MAPCVVVAVMLPVRVAPNGGPRRRGGSTGGADGGRPFHRGGSGAPPTSAGPGAARGFPDFRPRGQSGGCETGGAASRGRARAAGEEAGPRHRGEESASGRGRGDAVKTVRKLIEVALPLDDLNRAAAREKSIRHGHPSTLHLWWARRPLAAARAVLFAQLVDDPSFRPDLFPTKEEQDRERERLFSLLRELVKWENTTNEELLEGAREEIRESWRRACADSAGHPQASELFDPERLPAFHDPFAGGGTIPLEAQRLGLKAHASDLNPVAVLINKAMIEIPPKFAGRPPVNPESRQRALRAKKWKGAAGLAEDVGCEADTRNEEGRRRPDLLGFRERHGMVAATDRGGVSARMQYHRPSASRQNGIDGLVSGSRQPYRTRKRDGLAAALNGIRLRVHRTPRVTMCTVQEIECRRRIRIRDWAHCLPTLDRAMRLPRTLPVAMCYEFGR